MTTEVERQKIIEEIIAAIEAGEIDFDSGTVIPDEEVDRMFGISREAEMGTGGPKPAA